MKINSTESLSDQEEKVLSYLRNLKDISLKAEMEIVNEMSMCAEDLSVALESL